MALLFGTMEYIMGTGKVIVHPSYEQLMEFCRHAQLDAKDNPADKAFIASTGADLTAWPSKWRFREYEWAGEFRDGQLVCVSVYGMGKRGYVRVEFDYTLQAYRGQGLASKLHHDLETLWIKSGMRRFKTKAGSVAGVRLQASLRRTFWGVMPGGEFYVDQPLVRSAPEPKLPKELVPFEVGYASVFDELRKGRFNLSADEASRLARRIITAGGAR